MPARQAGVASGINNAVSSVASLMAIAIFGAVALSHFNRSLDERVWRPPDYRPGVRQAVASAKGKFVIEAAITPLGGEDRSRAESIIKDAFSDSIHLAMAIAAGLALFGAVGRGPDDPAPPGSGQGQGFRRPSGPARGRPRGRRGGNAKGG